MTEKFTPLRQKGAILSLYLWLVSCHSRDVAWHDKAMVLSPHLVFLLIGQVLASILFSVP